MKPRFDVFSYLRNIFPSFFLFFKVKTVETWYNISIDKALTKLFIELHK